MMKTMNVLPAVVLVAGLTACGGGSAVEEPGNASGTAASSPERSPTEPETQADVVPEEMQATWLLDVKREQIGSNLEKAGYGKLVDRFYESEGLATKRTTMTLTLYPDFFEIAWLLPDQTWDVGWQGPVRVEQGVLHFEDDYFEGVTDSFRPSVEGDELTLDFVKTNVGKVRGIPSEAYSTAYFSQPWALADCTPQDLDACR